MTINDIIESTSFVHREHKEWLSKLNFYQDEIKFFQNELIIVLHKHAYRFSFVESVDEYRKIFQKKLEHIDDLRHHIMDHERKLLSEEDEESEMNHQQIRERFNEFESDFKLVKKNFKRFAAYND